jgi:hypothetical protein
MSYNVKKGRQGAEGQRDKFRTFEDLEVYQVAREFRKKMYGVTRRLPDFEKFELASQIRRAAVSLTNNMRMIAQLSVRMLVPPRWTTMRHSRFSMKR